MIIASPDDLLENVFLIHEEFVDPKTVLNDDNICLLGCDREGVWFSITPKEVNILHLHGNVILLKGHLFNLRENLFIGPAQTTRMTHVILI